MSDSGAASGAPTGTTTPHVPSQADPPALERRPRREGTTAETTPETGAESFDAAADPLPTAVRELLDFLRRRLTGDYRIDEFGFDQELTDSVVLPPLRLLFEQWFRVQTLGTANLPASGGALLVCNHSGTLPLDALMTAVAVHDAHEQPRHLRMLGADLVFRTPFVGEFARKTGQTLACDRDAQRLLGAGELVGVWPEGFKGVGKPFTARYKLQRFGRGGFVSAALRAGVPIVPCSIIGAEEIYPKIGDIKPLARLLGLPYFPVTPFFPLLGPLGMVPLPTKWTITFGEPIRPDSYAGNAADDPAVTLGVTDRVRESIQQTLYTRLAGRGNPFTG